MTHASATELEQYIGGKLAPKEASAVQGHLDECEDCQLLLAEVAIQTQWKGPERRTEPRIRVDFKARLKLLDPVTSVGPPHDVQVIEISRSGLKVRTPRFVIPRTLVQIRFNGKTVLGEVRYCNKVEGGYDAGLAQKTDFPGNS